LLFNPGGVEIEPAEMKVNRAAKALFVPEGRIEVDSGCASAMLALCRSPGFDGVLIKPERGSSASNQRSIVLGPVSDAIVENVAALIHTAS